jgi:hypothetical protein
MKALIGLILFVLLTAPWVVNMVKFTNCDFGPDYKCEVLHGAGVFVPPLSFITVWFDDDE